MRSLVNYFKYLPRTAATLLLVALAFFAFAPQSNAGYVSHDQAPFDICNPAQKEGALEGVVFNNYINTDKVECLDIDEPIYGDERGFYAANYTGIADGGKHVIDIEPGQEISLSIYVHNNAHPSLNESGAGVAEDTRVSASLPTGIGKTLRSVSQISTNPDKVQAGYKSLVSDDVTFKSDVPVYLEYVADSAEIFTDSAAFKNGYPLNDDFDENGQPEAGSIFHNNGTLIGHDALDGEIPGCFEYQASVVYRVRVVAADIEFDKQVINVTDYAESEQNGPVEFQETVNAEPGDTLQWYLPFRNNNPRPLENVIVRDVLPAYLEVVPGSVQLVDSKRTLTLPDEVLFGTQGVNAETYLPVSQDDLEQPVHANPSGYLTYKTTVTDEFNACEALLNNTMLVRYEGSSEEADQASVRVTKDDCDFACDQLTKEAISENLYKFTLEATVNETTFNHFELDFGDGQSVQIAGDDVTVNGSRYSAMVQHEYSQAGRYTAKFTVFTGEGSATSSDCQVVVTVDGDNENPPELPNTGAGAAALGVGAIIPSVKLWLASRRKLLESLLNR